MIKDKDYSADGTELDLDMDYTFEAGAIDDEKTENNKW